MTTLTKQTYSYFCTEVMKVNMYDIHKKQQQQRIVQSNFFMFKTKNLFISDE